MMTVPPATKGSLSTAPTAGEVRARAGLSLPGAGWAGRLPHWLLGFYAIWWLVLAIRPVDRQDWLLENLLVRNISLPASVKNAIESKINAEQEAQKMQFVLQKERQEADRKRIEAEGIRDFQRTVQQGISPELLTQLSQSDTPVPRQLSPELAQLSPSPALRLDEASFRYALNDDAMATEKLAEGIRAFAHDAIKLEALF